MRRAIKIFFSGVAISALFFLTISATNREDYDRGKNLEIFLNIFRDVNLMYVDSLDSDKMINTAANAMLSDLDPYTEYMPKEEYEQFAQATSGKYGGMGAIISKQKDDDYGEVSEVFEGFPAYKAGLVAGDKLIAIDSVDIKNLTSSGVSEKLKGDPGSSFQLKIKSWLTDQYKVVTIKRELVKIPAVPYYAIIDKEKGVGYISLTTFSENCSSEVSQAIKAMQKEGNLKSLILDLRDNGGGILDEAVNIVSFFVDKGTEVVSMKGKLYPDPKIYRTKHDPIAKDLPLTVLVNGNSASASEIVSGSLQDLDRAAIIGSRTFGKGLVQTTRDVGYGSVIKVTTAKYYIPSGRCIQEVDFSKHNKDGEKAVALPDSLRKAFETKGGRVVYDGGGILPDSVVEPKKWTNFTIYASALGHTSGFAKEYFKKHPKGVDIDTFSLTEKDMKDFATYLKGVKFEVTTPIEYNLKKLKESVAQERYNGEVEESIKAIEEALKPNIDNDIKLNYNDLKRLIERDIITIYHYQKGSAKYKVATDSLVLMVKELNPSEIISVDL